MVKVAKFGGSSLADYNQLKKVKSIVKKDKDIKVVVVSAPGKRFSEDNKITDLLYLCYEHLKYEVSFEDIFLKITTRYEEIKKNLNLKFDLNREFDLIRNKMKKGMNRDYLISRGEYLLANLIAEYLEFKFIDAKDIIYFDFLGNIDEEKTNFSINECLKKYDKVVIPGFYGSFVNQEIKNFSRGGSDITGSIIARALKADIYENWTDVSGMLMADPKIVDNPKRIDIITYSELRELSYMGANVLHTDAVLPVRKVNIPINIRNTNDPNNLGTLIVNDNNDLLKKYPQFITGIAGKKNFSTISIYKEHLLHDTGILEKIIGVFSKYNLKFEHISTGRDNISIIVKTESMNKYIYEIMVEIKKNYNPSDVKVVDNISLITVVGRNMAKRIGICGDIFLSLGKENINIKSIYQDTDEINIIIGVDNLDFEKAINVIYNNVQNKNS